MTEYAVSQNFRLIGYVNNPADCRDLPMFDTCGGEFKIFKGKEKVYDSRLRIRCKKIRDNMNKSHLGSILNELIDEHKEFLQKWGELP